ncbi:MAG TPA: 4'-phosphopantetheinyl transferase superfamily protein [Acidimicrobiales bacterium]|nr:4'-phosphopantetheinyl transferase superfamily protein [Acidimicrobiales bacterium]
MTEPSITGVAEAGVAMRRTGYWLLRPGWSARERERMAGEYLDGTERWALAGLTARARDDHVLGRIAMKVAVCAWLADHGIDGVDARDVTVGNDAAGRPHVRICGRRRVAAAPAVSVAHRHGAAVAVAAATGELVGIDVEVVEPRGSVFTRLALTTAEVRQGDAAGIPRDRWVTRAWTIKEAVAKAVGTGLQGRPKDFVVQEIDGDWALATGPHVPGGLWVRSADEGDLVVSVVAQQDDAPAAPYRDA